jgi:hypothetical protein
MKKVVLLFLSFLLMGILAANAQMKTITGKVVASEDNSPIPGVSVVVKGTTTGTITNQDGLYSLQVPASAKSLAFSFVGYRTKEVVIENQAVINVVLENDVFDVDEVVVVAYGIQQKRDVSGTIATVKGEEIKTLPVQSFDQALQGKAAGVSITMPNGVLNNPPVIRIRGFNSISSSSDPLIVVDGVPMFAGNFQFKCHYQHIVRHQSFRYRLHGYPQGCFGYGIVWVQGCQRGDYYHHKTGNGRQDQGYLRWICRLYATVPSF